MFSVNISAISIDQITPGSEFYNFSVNPEKVAEILDTDIEDLNDKVKNFLVENNKINYVVSSK